MIEIIRFSCSIYKNLIRDFANGCGVSLEIGLCCASQLCVSREPCHGLEWWEWVGKVPVFTTSGLPVSKLRIQLHMVVLRCSLRGWGEKHWMLYGKQQCSHKYALRVQIIQDKCRVKVMTSSADLFTLCKEQTGPNCLGEMSLCGIWQAAPGIPWWQP